MQVIRRKWLSKCTYDACLGSLLMPSPADFLRAASAAYLYRRQACLSKWMHGHGRCCTCFSIQRPCTTTTAAAAGAAATATDIEAGQGQGLLLSFAVDVVVVVVVLLLTSSSLQRRATGPCERSFCKLVNAWARSRSSEVHVVTRLPNHLMFLASKMSIFSSIGTTSCHLTNKMVHSIKHIRAHWFIFKALGGTMCFLIKRGELVQIDLFSVLPLSISLILWQLNGMREQVVVQVGGVPKSNISEATCAPVSVTSLDDFWTFWATNFVTKVAQIF